MKLIVISGSPESTSQFTTSFKNLPPVGRTKVLVSNDIHTLIHQRRSANPPQYAIADVSDLSKDARETISRHFPEATESVLLPDGLSVATARFTGRKFL